MGRPGCSLIPNKLFKAGAEHYVLRPLTLCGDRRDPPGHCRRRARNTPSFVGGPSLSASHIEIGDIEGVILDEFTPALDDIAHQLGEHFIRRIGMIDADLQ